MQIKLQKIFLLLSLLGTFSAAAGPLEDAEQLLGTPGRPGVLNAPAMALEDSLREHRFQPEHIRSSMDALLTPLLRVKTALEAAAVELAASGRIVEALNSPAATAKARKFVELVQKYYRETYIWRSAFYLLNRSTGFENLRALENRTVGNNENSLDIELADASVIRAFRNWMAASQEAQRLNDGRAELFPANVSFRILPPERGQTAHRLILPPAIQMALTSSGFGYFPTVSMARDLLRTSALNIKLQRLSKLNRLLPPRERVRAELSPNLSNPQDRNFFQAMGADWDALNFEMYFRNQFIHRVMPYLGRLGSLLVKESPAGQTNGPSILNVNTRGAAWIRVWSDIVRVFASHRRPRPPTQIQGDGPELTGCFQDRSQLHPMIGFAADDYFRYFRSVGAIAPTPNLRDIIWLEFAELTASPAGGICPKKLAQTRFGMGVHDYMRYLKGSPEFYHLLSGLPLAETLTQLVRSVEKHNILYKIGCAEFVDAAGERSKCRGGTEEPQIFTTANGWTEAELTQLDSMVDQVMNAEYLVSDARELLPALEEIKDKILMTGAEYRRYRFAAALISGSEKLQRMEEMLHRLGAGISMGPLGPIVEERFTSVPRDMIEDPIVFDSLLAGHWVIGAAATENYLENPLEPAGYPSWYKDLFTNLASKALSSDATVRAQAVLDAGITQSALSGSNATANNRQDLAAQMQMHIFKILHPIVSNNLSSEELMRIGRTTRENERQECNGPLGFFFCLPEYARRVAHFVNPPGVREARANGQNFNQMEVRGVDKVSESMRRLTRARNNLNRQNIWQNAEGRKVRRELERVLTATTQMNDELRGLFGAFRALEAFHANYVHESESFLPNVEMVWEALFYSDTQANITPITAFLEDWENFHRVATQPGRFGDLFRAFFAEPSRRQTLIGAFVQEPRLFRRLIALYVDDLKKQLPALFTPVEIPESLVNHGTNRESRMITLHEFIGGLLAWNEATPNPASRRWLETATTSRAGQMLHDFTENGVDPFFLDQIAPVTFADMGTSLGSVNTGEIIRSVIDRHQVVGHSAISTMLRADLGAQPLQLNEEYWSREIFLGEVLPSVRDRFLLESCRTSRVARAAQVECARQKKAQRLLVSFFLKPFLRASQKYEHDTVLMLSNPRVAVHRELLQSNAMRSLQDYLGGLGAQTFEQLHREEFGFDQRLASIAETVGAVNQGLFTMFLVDHTTGFSQGLHPRAGKIFSWLMFVPAIAELGFEVFQASRIERNYSRLAAYARGSMVESDLIELDQLNQQAAQYDQRMGHFWQSIPLTSFWAFGMAEGGLADIRALRARPGTGIVPATPAPGHR